MLLFYLANILILLVIPKWDILNLKSQLENSTNFQFEIHPARKGNCPSCGHKNVFRYYFGLSREYGKCDRDNNCGYHNKPNQWILPQKADVVNLERDKKLTILYPETNLCMKTLNNRMSNFHLFCEKKLRITELHLRNWGVGTKNNNTETAFVYRNSDKKNVNIVYITYDRECKRIKFKHPYSLPAPSSNSKYSLCLFGEHNLSRHKIICLVESERTAIIASFFYQEFDWLATGGKDKLTDSKIEALFNRTVYYLVDADRKQNGKRQINSTIKRLRDYKINHQIIDVFPEHEDGYDIADAIIDGHQPEIRPQAVEQQDTIAEPYKSKPVRKAIQRLEEAKNQPKINQLVSFFWQTNELAVLFGDTGLGKSILAVAIADCISKGDKFLSLENENPALKVLYYDFELSDKQFEKRYSDQDGQHYHFNDNFYSDNIDFAALLDTDSKISFDEILFQKIVSDIKEVGAKVLIIDNITYLKTESPQETKIALEVMRRLNEIKKVYNLSILVLAHTPKRNQQSPITLNDLAGSKHISNFADSVFAIGKSHSDSNLRYLKQVKPSRSGEMLYDTGNVIVCEITKDERFLTFEFVTFADEHLHLKANDNKAQNELKEFALALKNDGKSIRGIAEQLKISKTSAQRLLSFTNDKGMR